MTKLPKYAIIHTSRYEAQHSAPLKTVRFAVLAQGVGTAFLFYDANGRLCKTVDYQSGLTHIYEYDSLGRLIFAWQKNTSTGATVLEVQNAYDELGRAKGSTYVIGDTTQTYGITYEDITGLVQNYTTPHNSFTYFYDEFDRLERKLGTAHAIDYTYVAGSQRIASYTIARMNNASTTYSYTYDVLGNITSVKKNGTTISNYEYDKLGRLIREDDCTNSVSWVYTYDNAGNLQQKYTFYGMCGAPASHMIATHPYNGSEISSTYTYGNNPWGDLLTGYNGITIEYTDNENPNTIGNPLNWRNATNMKWHQRSLTSMSIGGTAVYYTYNADGIRTQKTVGTSGHMYVLDGNTILKETVYTAGTLVNTLYYYYDESGISGVSYNGTKYTYVKNLQGDVIGIINSNGATVVEYKYDAWGNILSVTGSMASTLGATNPFRYRGYYYDAESGWYYLQSRYYDPQVGRFLNADGIVGANGGIMGYNMFAYCNNNPVMYVDPNGLCYHHSTKDCAECLELQKAGLYDESAQTPSINSDVTYSNEEGPSIIFTLIADSFAFSLDSLLVSDATKELGELTYSSIAQYENALIAAKEEISGFTTSLQWGFAAVGVLLDAGSNALINWQNSVGFGKILYDFGVDVALTGAVASLDIWVSAAVGSACCPGIGTIAGIGVSLAGWLFLDVLGVRDTIKSFV